MLSGAMNRRNVRRTNPPAFGSFRSGNRSIWIAILALPIAAIVPVAAYVYYPWAAPVQTSRRSSRPSMASSPLTPPSRLRGPGAIYAVDGRLVRKICEASPEVLGGSIDKSITVNRTHNAVKRPVLAERKLRQEIEREIVRRPGSTMEYSMKTWSSGRSPKRPWARSNAY